MEELKIIGWTDFECAYPTPKWSKEDMNRAVELIKEELAKNEYVFSGAEHQNSIVGVPVFSDGTCFRASMRCWGSICAEVYTGPNGEKLSYMNFYMRGDCPSNTPDYEEFELEPAVVQEESAGCTLRQDREMIEQSIALNMPFFYNG